MHFLGANEVKYTYQGQRISELRRAKLQPIAKALGVEPMGSKNEILGRVVGRLRALESAQEITDVLEPVKKPVKKPAKKAKKPKETADE